jgi:hypothetical protein
MLKHAGLMALYGSGCSIQWISDKVKKFSNRHQERVKANFNNLCLTHAFDNHRVRWRQYRVDENGLRDWVPEQNHVLAMRHVVDMIHTDVFQHRYVFGMEIEAGYIFENERIEYTISRLGGDTVRIIVTPQIGAEASFAKAASVFSDFMKIAL